MITRKVSIIVPIYNVAPYILECVSSIVQQTYQNIEVVMVDDCSTDDSLSLVGEFIDGYTGPICFKIIKHSTNKGLSSSRNTGIENASGDYLYFLDSDDFIQKTAIEKLVDAIEKNPEYGIAISYFCSFFEDVGSWTYRNDWLFDCSSIVEPEEFCYMMLSEKVNFASTAKLYKKQIFDNIRFQVGKRNEDTLLIVDMTPYIEQNKIKCINIPDYSYYYRQRTGSISRNDARPLEIDVISNYSYAIRKLQDKQVVVAWLTKRQLELSLSLLRKMYDNRFFAFSEYNHYCVFLSGYNDRYAKDNLCHSDYVLFRRFKYVPVLYRVFALTKGWILLMMKKRI